MKDLFFKITNQSENHYGYQYHDGLNILEEVFNSDPKASCTRGGFYFTTAQYIHEFYHYGIYLREVFLPIDNLNFKMVKDGNKWRSNMIILGEKHSLSKIETYQKFKIEYPNLDFCLEHEFFEVIKTLLHDQKIKLKDHCSILKKATEQGHLEIIKLLVEKGANLNLYKDYLLCFATQFNQLDIVKYLIENQANLHSYEERALLTSLHHFNIEMIQYLIEHGADIHTHFEFPLSWSLQNDHFELAEYLIEQGANFEINKNLIEKYYDYYVWKLKN